MLSQCEKNYKRGSRRLQSVWEVDVSRNVRFLRIKSSNLYTTIVFMRMILIPLRRLIVYVWQETRRRFWKEKGVHQIFLKYGDIRKICNLTHNIIWIQSKLMKQFMIMVVWATWPVGPPRSYSGQMDRKNTYGWAQRKLFSSKLELGRAWVFVPMFSWWASSELG